MAENKTGYFGVHLNSNKSSMSKPYQAQVSRGGKRVSLGSFATAEEAALCVARSPEGQAAAGRAAAEEGRGTLPAVPSGAIPQENGTVPAMAPAGPGAVVTVEALLLLLDDDLVGKEEAGFDARPKRQRAK